MKILQMGQDAQRLVAAYLATLVDIELTGRKSCTFERIQLELARSRALDAILMENAKATGYADAMEEIKTEKDAS